VLDVLFGQQLIANAPVCCEEAQHLAYGKMRAANRWSRREWTNTGASYFEVKSKPMAVTPQGHNIAASYIDCESTPNGGHGQ
jgi:hypothetical protein